MTPFDTISTPATTARNLIQFSGGILCQTGAVASGYLTNDPTKSSSSGAAAYLAAVDTVVANFQVQVTLNTADTQTSLQLLVNNKPVASQSINVGFTGPINIKAAQGITVPAGATIAVFMTNPGTAGSGQRVNAGGVVSNYVPASPARIYAPTFYFAGIYSSYLGQGTTEYFGDNAGENIVVGLTPSYPVGVACFLSNVAIQIFSTGGHPTAGITTISVVKNFGSATQQQSNFLLNSGILNALSLSIPTNSLSTLSFLPGDTVSCSMTSAGSIISCAITLVTARS